MNVKHIVVFAITADHLNYVEDNSPPRDFTYIYNRLNGNIVKIMLLESKYFLS